MSKRNYLYFLLLSALFFSQQSNCSALSSAFRDFGKGVGAALGWGTAVYFVVYDLHPAFEQRKLEKESKAARKPENNFFRGRDRDNGENEDGAPFA